jgi:hypothetical protein
MARQHAVSGEPVKPEAAQVAPEVSCAFRQSLRGSLSIADDTDRETRREAEEPAFRCLLKLGEARCE